MVCALATTRIKRGRCMGSTLLLLLLLLDEERPEEAAGMWATRERCLCLSREAAEGADRCMAMAAMRCLWRGG